MGREGTVSIGFDPASGPSFCGMPVAVDPSLGRDEWVLVPPSGQRFGEWWRHLHFGEWPSARIELDAFTYTNARPSPPLTLRDLQATYERFSRPAPAPPADVSPFALSEMQQLLARIVGRRSGADAVTDEYQEWRRQRGLNPTLEQTALLKRCEAICNEHCGNLLARWSI
jgi:hypothetical protein